jgi:hypothetical protein
MSILKIRFPEKKISDEEMKYTRKPMLISVNSLFSDRELYKYIKAKPTKIK